VRLASWSGHPTDLENLDCFFQAGTELMSIADAKTWIAEAAVDSAAAARISIGAPAKIIWNAAPDQVWIGQVTQLSDERFDPSIDSVRRDHPGSTRSQQTPQTKFLVRVELSVPESPAAWPVGSSGRLSIEMPRRSVWQIVAEKLAGVFRFR
jgi:putative peptide zinc metalloprotease protein